MKRIMIIILFMPICLVSQNELSNQDKDKADFLFDLLDVENSRPFLENKGWKTKSAKSDVDGYGNTIFKYTFSKSSEELEIWDYEVPKYQNAIRIDTDKSFFNVFFQLIQSSNYTMVDKQLYDNNSEETIYENNILKIVFKMYVVTF